MNKSNERVMNILIALRKLPRWALIAITIGVIIVLGVAMFFLLPNSENTQSEGDTSYLNSTGLAFSVFLKMGVVVLLIIGLAIVLRRWQSKVNIVQSKQVNLLETIHLSPHRTLYLVSLHGKNILIGATDQTITTLASDIINTNIPDTSANQNSSFSDVYNQLNKDSDSFETNIQ